PVIHSLLLPITLRPPRSTLFPTRRSSDLILTKILKRAKELTLLGKELPASIPLNYFLTHHITKNSFDKESLLQFSLLDDTDIITDRKSTRLNSSHVKISYAVFCLKKKKTT